jgi:hypothetical protein
MATAFGIEKGKGDYLQPVPERINEAAPRGKPRGR